ncbi:hypothetical protein JL475_00585 [Streptomyces sp. M2CJ-2]|uniref:hypothetical protein n=1 Tax=Streptomyces sp. M2CJ-2 TaxID=2803948 RepID=UPI001924782C|nr:hypothetical protein [Streptomyces sp. M2CJ-2]MBL3664543.1 hypothetical protein [Streptomyces sp. M2CJ-2]
METPRRPPISIQGATPGRVESRWCDKCQTDEGFTVRFYTFSGGEPLPLTDVTGCTGCEKRTKTS